MKNFKKFWKLVMWLSAFLVFTGPALSIGAQDCVKADKLFEQSLTRTDPVSRKPLLEKALKLCPTHAKSLNNLGTIYEEEGKLDKAQHAYRLANDHAPDLGAPLAGLGDVAMKQGRFQEATGWYEKFLAFLADEKQKGDPEGLGIYEEEYRMKYEQAKLKLNIFTDSMSGVVSNEVLSRGLKVVAIEDRLSKPTGPERLSLYIYFDFDSAELKPQGRAQLGELAQTMLSPENRDRLFMIEGHTDTVGPDDYNLDLSRRRAQAVRTYLVSRGIVFDRLDVAGLGESRPLVVEGDKEKQAINRRVEFLRMGLYGK